MDVGAQDWASTSEREGTRLPVFVGDYNVSCLASAGEAAKYLKNIEELLKDGDPSQAVFPSAISEVLRFGVTYKEIGVEFETPEGVVALWASGDNVPASVRRASVLSWIKTQIDERYNTVSQPAAASGTGEATGRATNA
ncbi:MAG: hypothetical protein GY937_10215 [bacterium]|nr:hypothetical protein [bacterium]